MNPIIVVNHKYQHVYVVLTCLRAVVLYCILQRKMSDGQEGITVKNRLENRFFTSTFVPGCFQGRPKYRGLRERHG